MASEKTATAEASITISCPIDSGGGTPSVSVANFSAKGTYAYSFEPFARGAVHTTNPNVQCQVLYPNGDLSDIEQYDPQAGDGGVWKVQFPEAGLELDDSGQAVLIASLMATVNGVEVVLKSALSYVKIVAAESAGVVDCSV
jgi:hypothetical protein